MERCEYLELVSEKIRRGEPVGMLEAIAAINYQGQLRAEEDAIRAGKWWHRALRRIMHGPTDRRTPEVE
jgi:hypothetical protein